MSEATEAYTKRDAVREQLAPLRARIDELDHRLVELLNERARVVVEVGEVKRAGGEAVPIYAPDREHAVLERVRRANAGPLPNTCIEAIWRELMSGSFALERALRIGYLGPPGSFSHLAARQKFGASVEYDQIADFPGIFDAVQRGHVDYGLIPIENSTHGGVTASLDCFLESEVRICAETMVEIHHNLLSRVPVDRIRAVASHPQVLGQCRKWITSTLPAAEREHAASSSMAAQAAGSDAGVDRGLAAIGSTLAAQLYDVPVLMEKIEDNASNTTRFFVIGKASPQPTGNDKTSILFTTEHKAGSLNRVLSVFDAHGLNLSRIAERPSQRTNWEYFFFVDFAGHTADENVKDALAAARAHCLQLKVLGSFPRADAP